MTTDSKRVPLVLISGLVGVGKTSVGFEVSDLLCKQGVAHTFIDLDQLRYTYPRPVGDGKALPKEDRFGGQLGIKNLRDVWRNAVAAGSRNLMIASVIETWADVEAIRQVVPGADVVVCQLRARVETLAARVRQREKGKGLDWHLRRSAELAEILAGEAVPVDFEVWMDEMGMGAIGQKNGSYICWETS
ncbi:MAG: hypothetical protein AAFP03_05360 [Cyanobacteria bacterium J06598_3]